MIILTNTDYEYIDEKWLELNFVVWQPWEKFILINNIWDQYMAQCCTVCWRVPCSPLSSGSHPSLVSLILIYSENVAPCHEEPFLTTKMQTDHIYGQNIRVQRITMYTLIGPCSSLHGPLDREGCKMAPEWHVGEGEGGGGESAVAGNPSALSDITFRSGRSFLPLDSPPPLHMYNCTNYIESTSLPARYF